jgi:hypothetical protein
MQICVVLQIVRRNHTGETVNKLFKNVTSSNFEKTLTNENYCTTKLGTDKILGILANFRLKISFVITICYLKT